MPLVIPADGAKVLIVKFNDFQCPACGQSYLPVQADPREVRGVESRRRCKCVLKDYPLNADCNDERAARRFIRRRAMRRSPCGWRRRTTSGEAIEEWLYTHQPEMTPASVRQAARDIGR